MYCILKKKEQMIRQTDLKRKLFFESFIKLLRLEQRLRPIFSHNGIKPTGHQHTIHSQFLLTLTFPSSVCQSINLYDKINDVHQMKQFFSALI